MSQEDETRWNEYMDWPLPDGFHYAYDRALWTLKQLGHPLRFREVALGVLDDMPMVRDEFLRTEWQGQDRIEADEWTRNSKERVYRRLKKAMTVGKEELS